MVNRDDGAASGRLLMPADLVGVCGSGAPDPLVNLPIPESPVMSAQDAARALCELFLTNAERGNRAGHDELVAELAHRVRAQQQSSDHHSSPPPPGRPTDSTPMGGAVLLAWITFSRVAEGSVTKQGDHYLDWGAPLPPYLAAPLMTLLADGSLVLLDADQTGCQRVTVTEVGQIRHQQLGRCGAGGVDGPVMVVDGDVRLCRDAVVLDDPGSDLRAAGAGDVRLPASSVEPVVGLTCAVRVAGLSDPDTGQNPPAYQWQQRGSSLQPEGTSLPVRVPGAHLHPQLRRPPSWAGPSNRARGQA